MQQLGPLLAVREGIILGCELSPNIFNMSTGILTITSTVGVKTSDDLLNSKDNVKKESGNDVL